LEKNPPETILIIKLSAIGDVIHTLPFLDVLRRRYPHAAIDWLIEEDACQIIEGHPALDRIIVSRRKTWQRNFLRAGKSRETLREVLQFLQGLRSREYDLVIDIQGLLKSGLMTGLVKGKRKVGFSGGREGSSIFLTERPFPVNYEQHALERYLQGARYLGCDTDTWKGDIPIRESDRLSIEGMIREKGLQGRPLIAINPMAKWKTKLWDSKKFAVLATRLQRELDCTVLFTGSGQDRPTIERIIQAMEARPVNLAGRTTLKELACLFSKCNLTVTTDTGPMHLAAAMGCPVVAIFGPTSPVRTGPYGEGHVVVREDVDCAPCYRKSCDHLSCMGNIRVEKVFDTVSQVLTSGKR
jgi:3-deoxy-D-manno-octulosonic-acid transferase/heptosyltransferase-1